MQKLRKSSCLGSQTISSPLAFAGGLFFIFLNYFPEKEGFLIVNEVFALIV